MGRKRRGIADGRALVLAVTAISCLLFVGIGADGARAREYEFGKCQADQFAFSTSEIVDFAARGMAVRRACAPEGSGRRGLITYSVQRDGRVARGARASVALPAPAGTSFTAIRWSGQICRGDSRYAIQLYAQGPTRTVPIRTFSPNRGGPGCDRSVTAGLPRPQRYNIAGTTRIVQTVRCVASARSPYCSAREHNFIRTFKLYARVADTQAPAVAIVPNTPLARGMWVRGTQALNYTANDTVGVRRAAAIAGREIGSDTRPCAYADRQGTYASSVPCPRGGGALAVQTPATTDGTQWLRVQALDAAGNPGTSAPVRARIDNAAPARVNVGVVGGQNWRSTNSFAARWVNPPEGDRAPITGSSYRLCPIAGGACSSSRGGGVAGLGLAVPGPGQWALSITRRDQAGNEQASNASIPVLLRYDPEPPRLGFEATRASDPARVSALVSDKYSGLADGTIEISRQGSATWQTLPTHKEGARLVSRVDDSRLAPGTYLLRARARDGAANEASSERRLDGSPMVLTLPVRIVAQLRAGIATKRTVRKTIRRNGKRRKVRHRKTTLSETRRVGMGRQVRIRGLLANSDGQAIGGAQILVYSRTQTSPERLVGVVRTGADGSLTYTATASSTRTIRLWYEGSQLILPAEQEVTLLVPARGTLHVSRRRAVNGQRVRFGGRLRGLPPPAGGKLIELQARVCAAARGSRCVAHRWQTFRTTHTDAAGHWRVSYRFARTCGRQRQRFRVRLPTEAGYPFETGRSRIVSVRVRGRPCR